MRTNLKLRVSFYTRHGKTSKVEQSPVMLRVSYEGRRATFGQVPIEVSPRDFGNGRVFVTHPNAKALNEQLYEIEADICFLAKDLYKKGILSIDTLLQAYRGEKSPSKYISALFDEMISDEKKKCEAGLVVKGTGTFHPQVQHYVKCKKKVSNGVLNPNFFLGLLFKAFSICLICL
ncbi:MAG: Arm DNA-binding domain-containing protein [Porphyromonas sp.]|nr:Arm DNA-binding domain-containing protein [Bacteroidales bacterium]MDY3100315.1 Arm DNA-binding domain-containing protein [Porphyromonas sp.]